MKSSLQTGTLYLVATPIGNLEDITLRALRTLKEADALFCEDTRRTGILLKHHGIERSQGRGLESFHDHSPSSVIAKIKKLLSEGRAVAYATDGGMPVVSDPGFVLVRAAHQCGAKVTVVPGPSAASTLFAVSGLPSPKYFFHGFFPRTRGEVARIIEVIQQNPVVHVFYEAPGRVMASLEILSRNLPGHDMVLGRELTKLHEEIMRDKAKSLFENLQAREKIRGECVFAVLGGMISSHKKSRADSTDPNEPNKIEVVELTPEQKAEVTALVKSGVSSKDAAKALSKRFGISRRIIYEFIIHHLT